MTDYLERATNAYLECALWSSSNWDDNDPVPFDKNHTIDDFDPRAVVQMTAELAAFLDHAGPLICEWIDARQMGHDFWLTRNGHGAGFWDRGNGPVGDWLTAAAKAYGTQDLYLDNNGRIDCQ